MKALIIGDFHGNFPKKFFKIIKKEKINLIVSTGDFCPFTARKIFFKYCWRQGRELHEVIGKKKTKELTKKDVKAGENVLKILNKINLPVVTVTGNLDYTKWKEAYSYKKLKNKPSWSWLEQDFFTQLIKKYKNINCIDYAYAKFNGFVFIGMPRSTFPGHVKSQEYKKQRKWLDNLFKKFKKEKIIFISHNVPYNTKLDLIHSKEAQNKAQGKHYGSKLVRRIIQKYQPILAIGGHIHESSGKSKLGKTTIINPGAAHEGKAAIIEINKKINVKFIK
jgi:Icc-related predicted phosphoesterase